MLNDQLLAIAICVMAIAFLYSSVAHAGASGYIAISRYSELRRR